MRIPGVRFAVEGTIVLVAMILLAALDAAFYSAYMANWVGKPKRGLAAWVSRPGSGVYERNDGLLEIAVQSVASLSAVLLALWVARHISRGRGGALVYVAVVFILLLVLISILGLPYMLRVIIGYSPPNG